MIRLTDIQAVGLRQGATVVMRPDGAHGVFHRQDSPMTGEVAVGFEAGDIRVQARTYSVYDSVALCQIYASQEAQRRRGDLGLACAAQKGVPL